VSSRIDTLKITIYGWSTRSRCVEACAAT